MNLLRPIASVVFLWLFWSTTGALCYCNYQHFGYYHKEWWWPFDTIFFAILYTPFAIASMIVVHVLRLSPTRTMLAYLILLGFFLYCVQAVYRFGDSFAVMHNVFAALAVACWSVPLLCAWPRFKKKDC
jgi:hypothetical protein